MYDSGLFFKWHEWADWKYELKEKLLAETMPLEWIPDFIEFDKIGATIIVLAILCCFALACEVAEYIFRNRRWFYFKVSSVICKKIWNSCRNSRS